MAEEPAVILTGPRTVGKSTLLTELGRESDRPVFDLDRPDARAAAVADGTVTVRGYISIPTDQAWFFTPQWLAGEREADEDIAAGRGTVHESAEDMFAHLDTLGAADG